MTVHANDSNIETLNEREQPVCVEPDISALAWGAGWFGAWDGSCFQVLKWYLDENGNRASYGVDADGVVYNPETEAPPGTAVTIYYRTDNDQDAASALMNEWYEDHPFPESDE